MLKRLVAADFDRPLISDLVATFVKQCNDFCNLSAVVIFSSHRNVAARLQSLWDRGVTGYIL